MEAQLSVELLAKIENFKKGFKEAGEAVSSAGKVIDTGVNKISSAVTSKFAGIFSTTALVGFGKAVLDVTADFQKFSAVLGNTLGSSSLAKLKLKEIQDFAAKTPFGVNELTGAFVKLANAGFKPTGDQMTRLGDLASSTGKSFDQLAEAILDAQSGEFERLKEFGIRAKDAGDSVIFTYKGVQTQVEKTSGSIREYITSLGDAQGVSGSMAKISETLGGQISNLGDNWDQMLLSVGRNTSGVFNSAIGVISSAINKITQYNEELEIASNYKLGSKTLDFFKQLNRAVNPFASKGATDLELATFSIKDANADVSKFVSESLAAAKSTGDFGKALADLKKKGDAALKSPIIKSSEQYRGIKDAYQLGVKALQDARTNFSNTPLTDANFGTNTAKGVKSVADILKDLNTDLKVVANQFYGTFGDQTKDKINAYQKAIDDLIKKGVDPASKAILKLKSAQDSLAGKDAKGGNLLGGVDPLGFNDIASQTAAKPILVQPTLKLVPIITGLTELEKKVRDFGENASEVLSKGLGSAFANIGTSIGNALAGSGSLIENLGASLLSTLGSVLTQLGEMAISVGVGLIGIKAALKSLNPAVAIAAGVALVALGAFAAKKASSIGDRVQGSDTVYTKPTAFANGGIIYGPTLGLMGEYAGAKSDPEVVAPLSKLKSILGQSEDSTLGTASSMGVNGGNVFNNTTNSYGTNGNNQPNIIVQAPEPIVMSTRFEISGEKLLVITERAKKRLNRVS